VVVLAYLVLTGTGIESADTRADDAPSDITMMMRRHIQGPPDDAMASPAPRSRGPTPQGWRCDAAAYEGCR
jgi:hypothetical protein